MKILTELKESPQNPPLGLIIGSFDGVHLGHQLLIKRLDELLGSRGTKAIITFSNHPSQVLKKGKSVSPICTKEEKIKFLEEAGVDLLYLLEFTPELASLTYEEFLKKVKKAYPFQYLVVGKGDAFGKGREGNEDRVKELEKKLNFKADYVEKLKIDGEIVSSGKIREFIASGDLKKAAKFLGRGYPFFQGENQ